MKKTIFFLLAAMVLLAISCDRKPKATDADLVLVDHGKMSFYDKETKKTALFEKETDSVINLLFDKSNHLYYTVSKDQKLSLKMIDMNVSSPEPKLCADWNMTLQESIDEISGDPSGIFWDKTQENIFIYKTDYEEYYMNTLLYNTKTGEVRTLSEEEIYDLYSFDKDFDPSHFYSEDKQFYYVTPEGKICLTDKMDLKQIFDEDEWEDISFEAESFSPDGQCLLFSANIFWGEGWGKYGVSSLDGASQTLLKESDIWDIIPQWLSDGSLVYIGEAPLPKDDPRYDEEWNTTQPCIKLIDPMKNTTMLSLGEIFAVKPFAEEEENVVRQGSLEGCDVAILDHGKVTFYNSTTGEFVPFVTESDSVINGVFVYGSDFFYTVVIGDELYLKEIFVSEYSNRPSMRTDWGLKLNDCVSETYGRASDLYWMKNNNCVGINHTFSWDFYNFSDIKFYYYYADQLQDGWGENDEETDSYDEEFLQFEEDLEKFGTMFNNFFYAVDGHQVCLSDKLNFKDYCSDPEYYSDPEFELLSIDPTRKSAAYISLIEWGDLGHGPLCYASLDGKVQLAFEDTDAADLTYGWLKDGSLLYVGEEPRPTDDPDYNAEWNNTKPCIKIVKPDGTVEVFSHATNFVVAQ